VSAAVRRVAALYDIHGNRPALEAVLAEVAREDVDLVVIGGDVVPGPMVRECLERVRHLPWPTRFIHGNCERAVVARMAALRTGVPPTYWGTVSGTPPPSPYGERMEWSARQLAPELEAELAAWPRTLRVDVAGLGAVVFCHSTPRDETEVFTSDTDAAKLRPIFDPLGADVIVCGHTHMPFDRRVGATRVVNAGSVGAPFGRSAAAWLLLGPDVTPRHTDYDVAGTVAQFRASGFPAADAEAEELLHPAAEADMRALYAKWELR